MGSRSTARRIAMQAVFQAELSGADVADALNSLFEEEKLTEEAREFSRVLATGAFNKRKEIDSRIASLSKNWSIDRVSPLDKSILRVAIYELTSLKDTPKAVVINEALELAKRYSDEDSPKFINGILGNSMI